MNAIDDLPTTRDAKPPVAITFALWVGLLAALAVVLVLVGVDSLTAIDNAVWDIPAGKVPVETAFARFFPPLVALLVYCLAVPLAVLVSPPKFFQGSLPTVLVFSYAFYGWFASALMFLIKFKGGLRYSQLLDRQILQFVLLDPVVIVPALQIVLALWLSRIICKRREISYFSEAEKGRLPWMPFALVVILQIGYFVFFDYALKLQFPNAS